MLFGLCIGVIIIDLKIKLTPEKSITFDRPYTIFVENGESNLLRNTRHEISSRTFLQTDLYKLPYQLDHPLDSKWTSQQAQIVEPPCRCFGEWLRKICRNNLTDTYVDYTLFDLIKLIDSVAEYNQSESRYLINGGANDGITQDPLYPLFTKFG